MTVLVDTGILLRLYQTADPQYAAVNNAVQVILGRGDDLAFAPQNAAEFWNVCTRPASARGGLGLDIVETDRRLRIIEATFTPLDEPRVAYPLWRGLVFAHAVRGKQAHDARLVALMMAHGVTHILTLNAGDFARFPGITEIAPASLAATP